MEGFVVQVFGFNPGHTLQMRSTQPVAQIRRLVPGQEFRIEYLCIYKLFNDGSLKKRINPSEHHDLEKQICYHGLMKRPRHPQKLV